MTKFLVSFYSFCILLLLLHDVLAEDEDSGGEGGDGAEEGGGGEGGGGDETTPPSDNDGGSKFPPHVKPYHPVYISSGIFGAMFIFGPLFVKKGENAGITKACIMMSAFFMWLFYVIIYLAQLNVLIPMRVDNTSLAWMLHTWGIKPSEGGGDDGTTTPSPSPEVGEG